MPSFCWSLTRARFPRTIPSLLSEFVAHTSPEIIEKNMGWTRGQFDELPPTELYIFEAPLPDSLEAEKRFLGENLETENKYTFKMAAMEPTKKTSGGEARIVDSTVFPVSKGIAAAMVTIRPGGYSRDALAPECERVAILDQGARGA